MKYKKEITIDIPYGVSDETAAAFLRETADGLKKEPKKHVAEVGDVYRYGTCQLEMKTHNGWVYLGTEPGAYSSGIDHESSVPTKFIGKFTSVFTQQKQ